MEASAQKESQDITIDETLEEVQVPENDGNKEISITLWELWNQKHIVVDNVLHIMLLLK